MKRLWSIFSSLQAIALALRDTRSSPLSRCSSVSQMDKRNRIGQMSRGCIMRNAWFDLRGVACGRVFSASPYFKTFTWALFTWFLWRIAKSLAIIISFKIMRALDSVSTLQSCRTIWTASARESVFETWWSLGCRTKKSCTQHMSEYVSIRETFDVAHPQRRDLVDRASRMNGLAAESHEDVKNYLLWTW